MPKVFTAGPRRPRAERLASGRRRRPRSRLMRLVRRAVHEHFSGGHAHTGRGCPFDQAPR